MKYPNYIPYQSRIPDDPSAKIISNPLLDRIYHNSVKYICSHCRKPRQNKTRTRIVSYPPRSPSPPYSLFHDLYVFPFGQLKGFTLFDKNSLLNFLVVILFLAIVTEVDFQLRAQRAFNVFDLVSNVVGVGIGVGVIRMVQRHQDVKT